MQKHHRQGRRLSLLGVRQRHAGAKFNRLDDRSIALDRVLDRILGRLSPTPLPNHWAQAARPHRLALADRPVVLASAGPWPSWPRSWLGGSRSSRAAIGWLRSSGAPPPDLLCRRQQVFRALYVRPGWGGRPGPVLPRPRRERESCQLAGLRQLAGLPSGSEGREGRANSRQLLFLSTMGEWSRHSDLNRGPAVYETAALPLSYVGAEGEYR